MIYAPIIIPTMNRHLHLKRCIESLQRNPWAQYTTLIFSLDYPLSEELLPDYYLVKSYIENAITGFNSVEIICQEHNLGMYANYRFLIDHVWETEERFIYLEDDNEVSPNFIEYMNKGLESYENDDDVIAICANSSANMTGIGTENAILTHQFSAYGFGTWRRKEQNYTRQINRAYFTEKRHCFHDLLKLYRFNPALILAFQSIIRRREKLYNLPNEAVPIIDVTICIYMILENKYVVTPCIRKTRNWGYDGSGENCPNVEIVKASEIDNEEGFIFGKCEKYECSRIKERMSTKLRACYAILRLICIKKDSHV